MTTRALKHPRNGVPACPGLDRATMIFTDAGGEAHDLIEALRLPLKLAAADAGRSVSWLRAAAKAGQVYPVRYERGRVVEVYACAVKDWKRRQVMGKTKLNRRAA